MSRTTTNFAQYSYVAISIYAYAWVSLLSNKTQFFKIVFLISHTTRTRGHQTPHFPWDWGVWPARLLPHYVRSQMKLHKPTYKQNPWNAETSLFRKADTTYSPNSINPTQNSPIKQTLQQQIWRYTTKTSHQKKLEVSYDAFQPPERSLAAFVCSVKGHGVGVLAVPSVQCPPRHSALG